MNQPRNPEPPVDSDQVEVDENLEHDESNSNEKSDRTKQPKGEAIGKNANEPTPE
ncbi:MAG: hypothetical protein JHC61_04600 [Burkholderiaceae bacterium]|nr:hypothetical protein [Burkholderiaceae bacterium]